MHDAPSVNYPVGRCAFAGGVLAGLWVLGGAALLLWHSQAAGSPWRHLLGAGTWLAAGGWAALAWWRSPAGELAWDGGQWRFGEEAVGAPAVALDLQQRLLVRVPVGRRRIWLWLERQCAPSYWDALRRAVYSRARTAAPQGAQLPPP